MRLARRNGTDNRIHEAPFLQRRACGGETGHVLGIEGGTSSDIQCSRKINQWLLVQ
jgi:hypothetical protein